MEGMPRFPMFAPEFKQATGSMQHFAHPIGTYIRDHYGQNPNDFKEAIAELIDMRDKIGNPFPSDELACLMKRYYAQLLMLSHRFPLDGSNSQLCIPFSWSAPALTKFAGVLTRRDSGKRNAQEQPLSYADIQFEMANVLFNIAAVHAHVAVETPRDTDDGIKRAFTHFGYAAYPLQVVRDEMDAGSKFASVDFDRDTLTFYLNVIMGQAQECMVEKALVESRKPVVIARLASHLFDLYRRCKEHLESTHVAEIVAPRLYKEWISMCSTKSATYGAISFLYMGIDAEDAQRHGERVSYYEAAKEQAKQGRAFAEYLDAKFVDTASFVDDVATIKYENAKKENDFIYHAKMLKKEDVKMAEALSMACAYSFNPLDRSIAGDDLFRALLPPTVVKAASVYDERKAELWRQTNGKLWHYDGELETAKERLEFDSLLNVIRSPFGPVVTLPGGMQEEDRSKTTLYAFPDELLSVNAFFRTERPDAIPELLEELRKVGDTARHTDGSLAALSSRLDAIDMPELATDDGVRVIKIEITRLIEASGQAKATNMELHRSIAEYSEHFHTLALDFHDLAKHLSPEQTKDYAATPAGARFLQLADKVMEMVVQRSTLAAELEKDIRNDDINNALLMEKDMDHEELFKKEVKKHDKILALLEQNFAAQSRILTALTDAHADFAEERKTITEELEKRNKKIITLVTAADEYFRVKNKAEEAVEFYTKVGQRAEKLETAVEGIEAAYGDLKRAHEEKRVASERKIAEERAAREARAAMDDFSMPVAPSFNSASPGSSLPSSSSAQPGRRARLGDYMTFYRQKMGGGPPGSLPSQAPPPPSLAGYGRQEPPPPPASYYAPPPLTMPSYGHGYEGSHSGAPSPAPSTISNVSYASPTTPGPPPSFNHPPAQQLQYPPQGQQSAVYAPPPPPPPSSSHFYHQPQGTQHLPAVYQTPSSSYVPPPQPQSTYNPPPPPQASAYAPPTSYSGAPPPSSFTPQSRAIASTTFIPPTTYNPPHSIQPSVRFPHAPPPFQAPPTLQPQTPSTFQSVPTSQTVAASFAPPPVSFSSLQYPTATMQGTGMQWPVYGGAPHPNLPGPGQQLAQVPATIAGPPTVSQAMPAPVQPASPANIPSAEPQRIQPQQQSRLPSLAELSAQLQNTTSVNVNEPNTVAAPALPPMTATFNVNGGASPWHRGLATSTVAATFGTQNLPVGPWQSLSGQMGSSFGMGTPGQTPPSVQAPPTQPPPQPVQPVQRTQTMDLLSDLFSGSGAGPAPLQPATVAPCETSVHTQASTTGVSTVANANTVPVSVQPIRAVASVQGGLSPCHSQPSLSATSVTRPAAAVLPMQQLPPAAAVSDEQMLSFSGATSVDWAPPVRPVDNVMAVNNGMHSIPAEDIRQAAGGEGGITVEQHKVDLSSITDSSSFSLGVGDAHKLAKRQLYAANRGVGERPPLNAADPLNELDPFWKNK